MRRSGKVAAVVVSMALGMALVACGGPPPPPREPLTADPPLNGAASIEGSVAATELQRGLTYLNSQKFPEAKEHFEKSLATQPNNAEAAFYVGLTREKTGDLPGAEDAYKIALASNPGLLEAAQNLAAIYLDEPSRPDDAIAILKDALAKTPDSPQLLQNLGYAYGLKGDVEGASKAYEAALAKTDTVELHLAYGTLLYSAKEMDRAAAELRKALAKAGDDVAMLATIGRMLGPAKAYADCVAAFDRAIKVKADSPELFVRRGTCRHELHDEAGARSDYEAAIKVDATFAAAHYYLGVSYLTEKKKLLAAQELEKAASLGRDTPIGKLAAEKLRGTWAHMK